MNNIKNTTNSDVEQIWIKIPYFGDKEDQLLKSLKAKFKHHFTEEVKFKIIQSTQTFRFCTNMKDQIPRLIKPCVVHQFNYPGCNDSCNGKTERNLCTRTVEHAFIDKESAIYELINILQLLLLYWKSVVFQ